MSVEFHGSKNKPKALTKYKLGKIKALALSVHEGRPLVHADYELLKKVVSTAQDERSVAFATYLKEMEGLTDEQLLARIQPVLEGRVPGKKGRPLGVDAEVHRDQLLLAYRLNQRGVNTQNIADNMKVSTKQAERYIREAKSLLRIDPQRIDIPQQVGETLNFYEDVRSMALAIASTQQASPTQRLNAMTVALSCEKDRNEFMTRIGVYAPAVAAHMQSLVVQQMAVMVNAKGEKDEEISNFMAGLANDLLKLAKAPVQSIASSQDIEGELVDE